MSVELTQEVMSDVDQVVAIATGYYNSVLDMQTKVAGYVNAGDFSKAFFLLFTTTEISQVIENNSMFARYQDGDGRSMGVSLSASFLRDTTITKFLEMLDEKELCSHFTNVKDKYLSFDENGFLAEGSDVESFMSVISAASDRAPFLDYQVEKFPNEQGECIAVSIKYIHADSEPTVVEMKFDEAALNEWADNNILVQDDHLEFVW